VKDENVLLGPAPVDTITPTSPAAIPAGVLQVIVVGLNTKTLVAGIPPNVTDVAPVKAIPVILILVPPDLVPNAGKIAETKGT
jgi:hypothetical protein